MLSKRLGSQTNHGQEDAHDANVKDKTIDNFSVSVRGNYLLKNASLKISHEKRYGVYGPNEKGKSTLLKFLAWRKIPVPKNIDILLVKQEIVGDGTTAIDAVLSANEELVNTRQEVESLEGEKGIKNGEKLAELYEKLRLMGADVAEAQASKILSGLGFTKEMQGSETRSFSGGCRMRVSLARALFMKPSLLLLDEPTNHLDLKTVLWLKEYLSKWNKTLIVVSHDQNFLNSVCNGIIHLNDFKLDMYRGSYEDFVRGYEQHRSELINVSFSGEKDFKLSSIDARIDMGTRVAIMGPNGSGKSMLLKLLAKELKPTEDQEGCSKQEAVRAMLGKFGLPSPNHITPIATLSGGPIALVRDPPTKDVLPWPGNANMAFDLWPTEDVLPWPGNANMAFDLRPTEDVLPWPGNANMAFDLRPTEDVLPWPGNANMAFDLVPDLQCLLRTFYIRRYLRDMHEDNYNGIVIPL
ncbi:ABC transporter F family member 4 [Tanacetum coccineum]